MAVRYIIVSLAAGILLGILDGLGNANPLAASLLDPYKPIAKSQVNFVFGIVADLVYGIILAGLFMMLYQSLPGSSGIIKGLSFAGIAWFLRVAMSAASTFVMFNIPVSTILYQAGVGLVEMAAIGILFGLTLGNT